MASMTSKRDYYEVLGVEKTATLEQIKKSYRKLALANHPDRNPGNQEAVECFKEASEAFEVLSNEDKRSRYDRFGHAGVSGANGQAGGFQDVEDIFGNNFYRKAKYAVTSVMTNGFRKAGHAVVAVVKVLEILHEPIYIFPRKAEEKVEKIFGVALKIVIAPVLLWLGAMYLWDVANEKKCAGCLRRSGIAVDRSKPENYKNCKICEGPLSKSMGY